MTIFLVASLCMLSGCHFCSDELMIFTTGVPMLGFITRWVHTKLHEKKCPHEVDKLDNTDLDTLLKETTEKVLLNKEE